MRRHQQQLKHNWQTCTMQDLMYSLLYPHLNLSSAQTLPHISLVFQPFHPLLLSARCVIHIFTSDKVGFWFFCPFYFATVPHPAVQASQVNKASHQDECYLLKTPVGAAFRASYASVLFFQEHRAHFLVRQPCSWNAVNCQKKSVSVFHNSITGKQEEGFNRTPYLLMCRSYCRIKTCDRP